MVLLCYFFIGTLATAPHRHKPPVRFYPYRLSYMFRCDRCHTISHPHVSPKTLITQTRSKRYRFRKGVFMCYEWIDNAKGVSELRKRPSKERMDDPGGKGWEIIEELKVCENCS